MYAPLKAKLQAELAAIRDAGTYKNERIIVSPQAAHIKVQSGAEVINFCANNYLGLANAPRLVAAALTVVRAYIVAGCPQLGLARFGGFEAWAVWVRAPDFALAIGYCESMGRK